MYVIVCHVSVTQIIDFLNHSFGETNYATIRESSYFGHDEAHLTYLKFCDTCYNTQSDFNDSYIS